MTLVMDTYGEICQTQLELDLKLHNFLDKYKLTNVEATLWIETFVAALSKKHEECSAKLLRNLLRRADRIHRLNTVANYQTRIGSLDAFVKEREGMMAKCSRCYHSRRIAYNALQRDYYDNIFKLSRKSLDCCAKESQKLHSVFDALLPFVEFYDHPEAELKEMLNNVDFTEDALTAVVAAPMQMLLTLRETRGIVARQASGIHARIGQSLARAHAAEAEQAVAASILSTLRGKLEAQVAEQKKAMDVLKDLVTRVSTHPRTLADNAGLEFDVERVLAIPTKYEAYVKHLALLEALKQQVVVSMAGIEGQFDPGFMANA
ncbi:hypothetical protein C8T65DRAFT_745544 [Cerioporus squamosus]|nr:hypothetical protein C8T65DRAFT_745544 [Cerioporus squamosus]